MTTQAEIISSTEVEVTRQFTAVKALIEHEGKILVLREAASGPDQTNVGDYSLVGGRVDMGERFDAALIREVQEECGLEIEFGDPIKVQEWRPTVREEGWQIIAIFFVCRALSTNVTLSEEHDDYAWIDPKDYLEKNLIENLHPVFEAYLKMK
jgi:ADP-ribose pyrophosphatase YjhB (NUDIX family)